jgi:hypothetical protein
MIRKLNGHVLNCCNEKKNTDEQIIIDLILN